MKRKSNKILKTIIVTFLICKKKGSNWFNSLWEIDWNDITDAVVRNRLKRHLAIHRFYKFRRTFLIHTKGFTWFKIINKLASEGFNIVSIFEESTWFICHQWGCRWDTHRRRIISRTTRGGCIQGIISVRVLWHSCTVSSALLLIVEDSGSCETLAVVKSSNLYCFWLLCASSMCIKDDIVLVVRKL